MKTIFPALASLFLAVSAAAAVAQSTAQKEVSVSIEREHLRDALNDWAQQTGYQLVSEINGDFPAPSVKGTLTPQAALERLLAGTTLTYQWLNDRVVAVRDRGALRGAEATGMVANAGLKVAEVPQGSDSEKDRANQSTEQNVDRLEEVVVTAQKRLERIQDVPVSITAISGDNLIRSGVFNTQELPLTTPGLTISNVGVLSTVNIRGVASSLQGISTDPALAIYVDGVYQTRFEAALFEMMDIKDVEVLKGPQVALYGRNALAGAILFTSNEPSNHFGGQVSAQYGSFDLVRVNGAIDVPLSSDKLLLRVAGLSISERGYMRNVLIPADRPGSTDTRVGRFTLKYLPTNTLDITLRGSREVEDGGVNPVKSTDAAALGSSFNLSSPYEIAADQPMHMPQDSDKLSLTANWNLGAAKLTSITGYDNSHFGPLNQDFDATEYPLIHIGVTGQPQLGLVQNTKTWSQEVYATGKADRLDWLVGGVYLDEKGDYNGADQIFGTNYYFPAKARTAAYAGYGQLGYLLFDSLKLTAGLRYSHEHREADRTNFGVLAADAPLQFSEADWSSVTPSFSASYHVAQSSMLYATFSKGFKSGSFDQFSTTPPVNPERIKSFEAGIKSSVLGGRAAYELSAYRYDYTDQQVSVVNAVTQSSSYVNAGSSRGRGVEASLHFLPMSTLKVDVGMAYQDATFLHFQTAVPVPGSSPTVYEQVDYSGNRFPQTPKFIGNLGATYSMRVRNFGDATVHADYYYSGSAFAAGDPANTLLIPSYSLVNARISFMPNDSRINFSAFGKNLTNEVIYTTMGSIVSDDRSVTVRPPRTYGIEVAYTF